MSDSQPGDDSEARRCGLRLLAESEMYEGYVVPTWERHLLRRRRFPPYRRAIIGLVARQRRFLRAAYALADADMVLEAVGPLRSMLEALVIQRWLAANPDRNWMLWMEEDHRARDLWRARLGEHAPALRDAAVDALTSDQLSEGRAIEAARAQVQRAIGEREPDDRSAIEQRAAQVGLSFIYDGVYRYYSQVAVHPTMFSVDVMLARAKDGLEVLSSPTAQFRPPPIHLHGAMFLAEALRHSGEINSDLQLPGLPELILKLEALVRERADATMPGWQELFDFQA